MSASYREIITYNLIKVLLLIRPFFVKTGIEQFIRARFDKWLGKRFGHIDIFEVAIQDKHLTFSSSDCYSKEWFFPRYYGGKLHEEPVTMLLVDKLKDAKCFVDVGANLGWYICVASVFMEDGTVYGFEMDDLNFALGKKNLEMNGGNGSNIFHLAVSDTSGEISYTRDTSLPSVMFRMSSTFQNPDKKNIMTVPSITLDSFFQEKKLKPDIVKIDVEGAEIKVLRGMRNLLKDSAPKLFVEVHPLTMPDYQSCVEEVINLIMSNGYEVFEIENLRRHGGEWSLRKLDEDSKLYFNFNAMLYAEKP
jgi:FkbM family methyltransferase